MRTSITRGEAEDIALGMVSFGIPELYHIYEAIYYDDEEALAYHLKIAGIVHGLWFAGYKLAQAWEWFRHSRTIMPFHQALQGKGALIGQFARATAPVTSLLASTYAQSKVWEHIGDPMTGAVHYSGAGTMSGGSMPVMHELPTWRDVQNWWESL